MMRKAQHAKALFLLVVMLVVTTSNSFAQASFETIDGIRYLIDADAKTATVVPSNGEKYSGEVVVPEKVKAKDGVEYPVTAFGDNAFKECGKLTSISIPSSVTTLGNYCFYYCTGLETVTFNGDCPTNTQGSSIPTSCILYVPKTYYQSYMDAIGSQYPYINVSKDDGQGEDKPTEACYTPIITYSNGVLRFSSYTNGAQYHYTITCADIATDAYSQYGDVNLAAAYNITAYATAEGYKASDKATAVLYWVKANGNLEDTTNSINQAKTRGIVATSQDGIVTISGLDNGEEVRFYFADGKQIGAVKAIDGVASQSVSSASLVIAKIGGQAIKIAVK